MILNSFQLLSLFELFIRLFFVLYFLFLFFFKFLFSFFNLGEDDVEVSDLDNKHQTEIVQWFQIYTMFQDQKRLLNRCNCISYLFHNDESQLCFMFLLS